MEVIRHIPRRSVDLLLTDPPYGVNYKSRYRTDNKFRKMKGDDGVLDVLAILAKALKLLKRHRHLYVFGKFNLSNLNIGEISELIWNKGQVSLGNLEKPWGNEHEIIQFAMEVPSSYDRGRGMGSLVARIRKG